MSYCFKVSILAEICIKICYFYWKITKIAQRWGTRSQTPLPPAAKPPDPQWPPEAASSAPRPRQTQTPCRNLGYATGHHQFNALLKRTVLQRQRLDKGPYIKDVRTKSRKIDPSFPLSTKCPHWLNTPPPCPFGHTINFEKSEVVLHQKDEKPPSPMSEKCPVNALVIFCHMTSSCLWLANACLSLNTLVSNQCFSTLTPSKN